LNTKLVKCHFYQIAFFNSHYHFNQINHYQIILFHIDFFFFLNSQVFSKVKIMYLLSFVYFFNICFYSGFKNFEIRLNNYFILHGDKNGKNYPHKDVIDNDFANEDLNS
jgi:hypothetical protein